MATTRKTRAATRTANRGAARSKQATPERDSHARDSKGRFKADHHVRNAAFGATAALGAVAAGVAAAFKFGLLDRFLPRGEGHDAEDLLLDAAGNPNSDQRGPDADRRAPADFRPDIDAPLGKADKEALRPATGKPSLAASVGEMESQ